MRTDDGRATPILTGLIGMCGHIEHPHSKKGGTQSATPSKAHQKSGESYPWRVFIRGLDLLMTYTRPLRRTMRQFLSRFLADFSEFLIFMIRPSTFLAPEALEALVELVNLAATLDHARTVAGPGGVDERINV